MLIQVAYISFLPVAQDQTSTTLTLTKSDVNKAVAHGAFGTHVCGDDVYICDFDDDQKRGLPEELSMDRSA